MARKRAPIGRPIAWLEGEGALTSAERDSLALHLPRRLSAEQRRRFLACTDALVQEARQRPPAPVKAQLRERCDQIVSECRRLQLALGRLTAGDVFWSVERAYANLVYLSSPPRAWPAPLRARQLPFDRFWADIELHLSAVRTLFEYAPQVQYGGDKPARFASELLTVKLAQAWQQITGKAPPRSKKCWFVAYAGAVCELLGLPQLGEDALRSLARQTK